MDKPKTTPKDFFLWAGAIITFYWSVIAFILLTFDYINYTFPNALSYYPADPYQSGISYERPADVDPLVLDAHAAPEEQLGHLGLGWVALEIFTYRFPHVKMYENVQ